MAASHFLYWQRCETWVIARKLHSDGSDAFADVQAGADLGTAWFDRASLAWLEHDAGTNTFVPTCVRLYQSWGSRRLKLTSVQPVIPPLNLDAVPTDASHGELEMQALSCEAAPAPSPQATSSGLKSVTDESTESDVVIQRRTSQTLIISITSSVVLLEVLRRLKRMSKISIDILKETGIGLIVNKLRLESPDEEVRSAAVRLRQFWKVQFRLHLD